MHIFVWGSILIWLVAIPITNAPGLYGLIGLFEYLGVSFEVIPSATFWLYLPLVTSIALLPTIMFRSIRLDVDPHIVDDVRLLQKKEGMKLFKRRKFRRKTVEAGVKQESVKRRSATGYAFSHTEGYGQMITTGHIFGMNEDEIFAERQRRISTIISAPPSCPETPSKEPGSTLKSSLIIGGVTATAAIVTHGIVQEESGNATKEVDVEIHKVDLPEDEKSQDKQSPVVEEKNVRVHIDVTEEEAMESGSDGVSTDDKRGSETPPKDAAYEVEGSRSLLLPEKKDGSSSDGEGESNLTEEVRPGSDDPPVAMNLPGSVEDGPSSDGDQEEEGTANDQEVLL